MTTLPDDSRWPAAIDWTAPPLKPSADWRLSDADASCRDHALRTDCRTTLWMEVLNAIADGTIRREDWTCLKEAL